MCETCYYIKIESGLGYSRRQFDSLQVSYYSVDVFVYQRQIDTSHRVFYLLFAKFLSFTVGKVDCFSRLFISNIEFVENYQILFF